MNTNNQELKPKTFHFDNKFKIYIVSSLLLVQYILFMGKNLEINNYLKAIMCILPAAPLVLALLNFTAMMKKDDEMSTKMVTEALSLTFCISITWTLVGGLLQTVSILPNFSFFTVFMVMLGTFSISYLIVSYKYK